MDRKTCTVPNAIVFSFQISWVDFALNAMRRQMCVARAALCCQEFQECDVEAMEVRLLQLLGAVCS